MKLLIKILLFIFVALLTNVTGVITTIVFPSIQEANISFLSHKEVRQIIFKVIENDLANCYQNE